MKPNEILKKTLIYLIGGDSSKPKKIKYKALDGVDHFSLNPFTDIETTSFIKKHDFSFLDRIQIEDSVNHERAAVRAGVAGNSTIPLSIKQIEQLNQDPDNTVREQLKERLLNLLQNKDVELSKGELGFFIKEDYFRNALTKYRHKEVDLMDKKTKDLLIPKLTETEKAREAVTTFFENLAHHSDDAVSKEITTVLKKRADKYLSWGLAMEDNQTRLTEEQIDLCVSSPFLEVRGEVASRTDIKLTSERRSILAKDIYNEVRIALSRNESFRIEREEASDFLQDYEPIVRCNTILRKDMTDLLSDKQINDGLNYGPEVVKIAFASSTAFTPNEQQVKNGLSNENPLIRQSFLRRKDIELTKDQIDTLLTDPDPKTKVLALNRPECNPSQSQINNLLLSSSPIVQFGIASCNKLVLSEKQIAVGVENEDPLVKALFLKKRNQQYNSLREVDFYFGKGAENVFAMNSQPKPTI